jgi:phosphoenolpyruvate carboxykinase (GTP)
MIERIYGEAAGKPTILGNVPVGGALDFSDLDLGEDAYDHLFEIDREAWKLEATEHRAFLNRFGARLPEALWSEHSALARRVGAGPGLSAGRWLDSHQGWGARSEPK